MILLKTLILLFIITGLFILIYKNLDKLKEYAVKIKEKTIAVYTGIKMKVMNVFFIIKNFFGERFLRRLPISRASSKESEIAQAGKNIKTAGK